MEQENRQIEQQDLNVEMEANEKKIEISEKGDQLIKKSITYLQIGFWTIIVWSVLALISALANFSESGAIGIVALIFIGAIFGVLLIKMYAYIGDYKVFRKTKTQQALEDLLDAQKGYYGFIYLLPVIMVGVALVAFILGDLPSGRF
jgi:uncharacterized membrane-anchored protein